MLKLLKYVKTLLKSSARCQFRINIEAQFNILIFRIGFHIFDDRVRTKNFRFYHCAKRLNYADANMAK